MTTSQAMLGLAVIVGLATVCQGVAARLRLPAILLLLPVGFAAGALIGVVDPPALLGPSFSAFIGLGVGIVLFEGGLDLRLSELRGPEMRVVRQLLAAGVVVTWAVGTLLGVTLLGMSSQSAFMFGTIVIVSGPTVVQPLLELARPGRAITRVLAWEGSLVDPVGAVIGVLVFTALSSGRGVHPVVGTGRFLAEVGLGLTGAAVATGVLWLLLVRLRVSGVLATEIILAVVVAVTAGCDALAEDTGLIAALATGIAMANLFPQTSPEHRPFFTTIVALVIGVLFVTISATVPPAALKGLVLPSLAVVAGLVLVARPVVAWLATLGSGLSSRQRVFIGFMHPRGIVAAATASTFGVGLAAAGIAGAEKLLPATFLVIVATVTVYGLGAAPAARVLGLADPSEDVDAEIAADGAGS